MLTAAGFLRVAFSIVDPLGGSQSLVVGAPVEEAGVDVERVQQVGGSTDHPDNSSKGTEASTTSAVASQQAEGRRSPVNVGFLHHGFHPVIELKENLVLRKQQQP